MSGKQIALLRDDEGQFVEIPPEFEFESDEVLIEMDGDRLVVTPLPRKMAPPKRP